MKVTIKYTKLQFATTRATGFILKCVVERFLSSTPIAVNAIEGKGDVTLQTSAFTIFFLWKFDPSRLTPNFHGNSRENYGGLSFNYALHMSHMFLAFRHGKTWPGGKELHEPQ